MLVDVFELEFSVICRAAVSALSALMLRVYDHVTVFTATTVEGQMR